jgi:AcrR family transcriptional regulator
MLLGVTRPYTMRARATAVAETRDRIVAAALALAEATRSADLTLDAVAARAEVGVRTVLRHFGSRDGLLEAVFAAGRVEVEEERLAPEGDVDTALTALVAHYERRGDLVMHLLAQEGTEPPIDGLLSGGRELHRRWVRGVFNPWLVGPGAEGVVDLLVVVTDVYAWKLLRRDRALSAADTTNRLRRLVDAVLAHEGEHDHHV